MIRLCISSSRLSRWLRFSWLEFQKRKGKKMELSLQDLRELLGGSHEPPTLTTMHGGYKIVVCQRGFVYAGNVEFRGDYIIITDAVNLRVWGTTNGLGQLALFGATPETRADSCGTVRVHELAAVSVIDCKELIRATA
tara:strand:- start:29 stop:442 length:414 start_codon:yes stop_codon:yes gene_type:complete